MSVNNARRRLGALARLLDSAVRVPGTEVRIGTDVLLNIIPGLGTLASKGLSAYLILEARRFDVPTATLLRMAGNVGVDFVIGAIPIVGWVGDAIYRSNLRNMALLNDHLDATQSGNPRNGSKLGKMREAMPATIMAGA
jgi:hypothetical protein